MQHIKSAFGTLLGSAATDVYEVTDHTGPCRVLVNLWEDPESGGRLSLRVKPEITNLKRFLKYEGGESTFEAYTAACQGADALRSLGNRLDRQSLVNALHKPLDEQGTCLRLVVSERPETARLLDLPLAVCSDGYWTSSPPTLCGVDRGCRGRHHLNAEQVSTFGDRRRNLRMDWEGDTLSGKLSMTIVAAHWFEAMADIAVDHDAVSAGVERFRRLTELGAAQTSEWKSAQQFLQEYKILTKTVENYQRFHPFVKQCKLVLANKNALLCSEGSVATPQVRRDEAEIPLPEEVVPAAADASLVSSWPPLPDRTEPPTCDGRGFLKGLTRR